MRYAVISDIHANLEAFQVVLKDIETLCPDAIICLGDIVGYYPNPNECVEFCREHNISCIRGNHDDAAVGFLDTEDFNPVAKEALHWTSWQLKKENKKWLANLPEHLIFGETLLAVHGSPWHPYAYIFSEQEASKAFIHLESHFSQINVCFFGHTHQRAFYYTSKGTVTEPIKGYKYILGPQGLYLINPGSIGQPRDGIPGAYYVIYDSLTRELEFRRLEYDFRLTQEKTRAAGLPAMLAERLALGF